MLKKPLCYILVNYRIKIAENYSYYELTQKTPHIGVCSVCSVHYRKNVNLKRKSPARLISGLYGEYCKWCYSDGEFKYTSKEQLIDFCVEHMANENWPAKQVRSHMEAIVPKLNHWK
ncbi:MAG: zinc ribbon domain-containing protein [Clostridiales bacterium]|nr:zinc ribbon domain-containing protein [Clostridiales bacterium]